MSIRFELKTKLIQSVARGPEGFMIIFDDNTSRTVTPSSLWLLVDSLKAESRSKAALTNLATLSVLNKNQKQP